MTAWLLLFAATGTLTGCLGRSPDVHLYTLTARDGRPLSQSAPGLAVMVGPARLPQYLDRPEIALRLEGGRIQFDPNRRWAGGLEANVLRALGDGLAQRLSSDRVAVYPGEPAFPVAYRVSIDFNELVADEDSGELRLEARWAIRDEGAPPSQNPTVGSARIVRSIGRGGADAIVRAHDEALGALADAIAERLVALSTAGPPAEAAATTPAD